MVPDIVTVEGLAKDGVLDPVQQAIIDQGGVQCGFCTPGILISARALLDRNPDPSEDEIREALVGNLCRCTGYLRIVDAVQERCPAPASALSTLTGGVSDGYTSDLTKKLRIRLARACPGWMRYEKVIGAA